jgi:prepilin-type processing-associated H-X9-DG protein
LAASSFNEYMPMMCAWGQQNPTTAFAPPPPGNTAAVKFPLSVFSTVGNATGATVATMCPLPQTAPSEQSNFAGPNDFLQVCDMSRTQSGHTGGLNVCLGDGSVRFVAITVTQTTWNQVCDPRDSNPLGADWTQ